MVCIPHAHGVCTAWARARSLFHALMTAPADRVAAQLTALMRRVGATNEMLRAPVDVLAMRLHEQYPGDVGVFCVYLLNYTKLEPGQVCAWRACA